MDAKLVGVNITRDKDDGHLSVWPVYGGVDRPEGTGTAVKDMRMACRLRDALLAGKAVTIRGVRTDMNGKTYVDEQQHVSAKYLNADLRKLGF
jgi:hypothetical protein